MSKEAPKPIETRYNGRRFRSRVEARWAVAFDHLGLKYDYEREGYDLDGNWYLPDFHLPEIDCWIEVKGQEPSQQELNLCSLLAKKLGKRVFIAIGPPSLGSEQFVLIRPDGSTEPHRYMLLEDRRTDREYWFASTCGTDFILEAFSIGPEHGPPHDRYPLVRDLLTKAFSAALSARFEHGEEG
jgi:hypothetical protein